MIASLVSPVNLLVRSLGVCCLIAMMVCTSSAQTATDVGLKKLNIVLSGIEKELRQNIEGYLEIWSFNDQQIPSVARLRYLHGKATEQIESALRPFGYYRPVIETELLDVGSKWQAVYRVDPRDRINVTSEPLIDLLGVQVDCDDFRYKPRDKTSLLPEIAVEDDEFNKHKALVLEFCAARGKANLIKGQPFDHQAYDILKQVLQTAAARYGYFDARFSQNEIRIDIKKYTAEVGLVMEPGARYRIGEAIITQDVDWIAQSLLERYVELEDQDYFDAGELQRVQTDLTNSEYYKRVEVRASVQDAIDKQIPVQVDLGHIQPREYVFGIGYGTDIGVRLKFAVDGRRINRRGHKYNVQAKVQESGYGLAAGYTIPTGDPRTDNFGLSVGIEQEKLETGDTLGITLGANYQFRDGKWLKTYAVDYSVDEFDFDNESTTTRLLMPSIEWTRTFPVELEKRINTVNGNWVRLGLRGSTESLLSDVSFVQPQLSFKKINTFSNNHRLLLRASAATTWVSEYEKLPVQLRYYTGGDSSVRGYEYRAVAPADGQGGRHLLEASVEYEVPVRDNFSIAAFSDFGDAFNDEAQIRAGLGVGLRWRSPIGPVRIDVAKSLDDPVEDKVRLHFSLGPDL